MKLVVREWIFLGWALISSVASIVFWWPVFWQWALANPNAAAWVQALGSIGAIGVAIFVVGYQNILSLRAKAAEERQEMLLRRLKTANLIEQAQMYSMKVALRTVMASGIKLDDVISMGFECETVAKQIDAIESMLFADTPALDSITIAQTASKLLAQHASALAQHMAEVGTAADKYADQVTILHTASLQLSEKLRISAINVRQVTQAWINSRRA
jgi:hypothetical protein